MTRAVTLVAAVVLVSGCGRDRSPAATGAVPAAVVVASGPATAADAASAADPGPVGVDEAGRPAGFTGDAEGARAAAVAYAGLTGTLMTSGFITRADLLTGVATVRYGPELVETTATEVRAIEERLQASGAAGQLVVAEHPLRARVLEGSPGRVTVQVWSVLVLGAVDGVHAQQLWRTSRAVMVWENDDWRVDSWSASPGPTPALVGESGVSPIAEIADRVAWPAVDGVTAVP